MSHGRTLLPSILVTLSLVAILGIGVSVSIFMLRPRPDLSARQPSSLAPMQPVTVTVKDADLRSDPVARLDLPCAARVAPKPMATRLKQIRFEGDDCAATTELINETNGFTATIFAHKERGFQTDLVSLEPGLNRIKLVRKMGSGKNQTAEIEITRVH